MLGAELMKSRNNNKNDNTMCVFCVTRALVRMAFDTERPLMGGTLASMFPHVLCHI